MPFRSLDLGQPFCPLEQSSGAAPSLSNDTSLATFTIDSEDVLEQSNIQRGNGVTEVAVVAVPTHAGATRTINGSADADPVMLNLSTGDNVVTVTVTAEDGVTTEDHVVTVRRLTAGVQEITVADFGVINGGTFATSGEGQGLIISRAAGRFGFWGQTGTESQPDWSAGGVTDYIQVNLDSGSSVMGVGAVFETSLESNGFTVSNNGIGQLTITDPTAGARTDAEFSSDIVGSNGLITVTQQGENPS